MSHRACRDDSMSSRQARTDIRCKYLFNEFGLTCKEEFIKSDNYGCS